MSRPSKRATRKARKQSGCSLVIKKNKVSKTISKRISVNSNGVMTCNSAYRKHNLSTRSSSQLLSSKGSFVMTDLSYANRLKKQIGLKRSVLKILVPYESKPESRVFCVSKKVSKVIKLLKVCQE